MGSGAVACWFRVSGAGCPDRERQGGHRGIDKILGRGNPDRMSSHPSLLGASIGT